MVVSKIAQFGAWTLEASPWFVWPIISVIFLAAGCGFEFSNTTAYYAAYWAFVGFILSLVVTSNVKSAAKHDVDWAVKNATFRPFVFSCTVIITIVSLLSFIGFTITSTSPYVLEAFTFATAAGICFGVCLVSSILAAQMLLVYGAENSRESAMLDNSEKGAALEEYDYNHEKPKAGACQKCCVPILWLIFAIVGGLCAVEALGTTVTFTVDAPQSSEFVVVNDRNVHVGCDGEFNEKYPPVMLEHGWGGSIYDMIRIRRDLSNITRVCSYSRAGYGYSQVGLNPIRSSDAIADEMELVMQELFGDRQVVIAGHSFAGHNMRLHQKRNPERILGIVFVDALNADTARYCEKDQRNGGLFLWDIGRRILAPSGLLRLLLATIGIPGGEIVRYLPEDVWDAYNAQLLNVHYFDLRLKEFQLFPLSCSFVKGINDGENKLDIPVVHIYGEQGIYKGGYQNAMALANISSVGEFVELKGDDAGHAEVIFLEKYASQVSEKIAEVLEVVKLD